MSHPFIWVRTLLLIMVLCSASVSAQVPTWQDPPALVVGVVVDQMRADYIYRFWDNFGDGGFKRLVAEGAFCRDAHYPYATTDTGPGHASIYTGSVPAFHGVVANDRFERRLGRTVYCVEDTLAKLIGAGSPSPGRSPKEIQASTIADELERATNGNSHTIGISLKDRSAILPIGRTGDAAYWLDGTTGFVTSDHYAAQLPGWMIGFNKQHPVSAYMKGKWEAMLPAERYHSPLPDNNEFERHLPGTKAAELPVDLDALYVSKERDEAFIHTPGGNTILTDLAMAAITGENLGKDRVTDLLAISYSAPDKLGHRTGPLSMELEDMYIRLDLEIARLLRGLDEQVGPDRYTLFLTADHGVGDIPAYRASIGASAGYVDLRAMRASVEEYLQQAFGAGPWVKFIDDEKLFLDRSMITARGLAMADVLAAAASVAREQPGILDIATALDLERNAPSSGPLSLLAKGHHVHRGADLYFLTQPGYQTTYPNSPRRGTDHGSPWTYDTHVPMFFFGKGIQKGEVVRRVAITDIAPTITMLLGCALPDAAVGQALPEVLR